MRTSYMSCPFVLQCGRLLCGPLGALEPAGYLVGGALLHAARLLGALARRRVPEGAPAVRVVVEVPEGLSIII